MLYYVRYYVSGNLSCYLDFNFFILFLYICFCFLLCVKRGLYKKEKKDVVMKFCWFVWMSNRLSCNVYYFVEGLLNFFCLIRMFVFRCILNKILKILG